MKKILKVIGIILAVLILLVASYVAYAFISYHRLPDMALDIKNEQTEVVQDGEEYTILSYNIGFGAYEPDYGFFMDGGKESWAFSKERLDTNLKNIGAYVSSENADFVFLQEVDSNSTRSYHVDEREYMADALSGFSYTWAQNYDSPFLMYPILKPHGKSRSGVMTFSEFEATSAERKSLPVETSFMKMLDLDRCYSKTVLPVSNGKELVLYNFHLSAYTSDGVIAEEQLRLIVSDLEKEVEKGNYCIAGGDFNKDLSGDCESYFHTDAENQTWAQPIPAGIIHEDKETLVFPYDPENPVPSCRNADGPYTSEQFQLTIDGFLVSNNVKVLSSEVKDIQFKYSDHNPVEMTFILE